MTRSIKHLLRKCENWNKAPQHLCQCLVGMVVLLESQCLEHRDEIPEASWLARLDKLGSSGFK